MYHAVIIVVAVLVLVVPAMKFRGERKTFVIITT